MKRLIFGLVIISLVYLLLFQLKQTAAYGQSPSPITGPLTHPISYFKVSGRVTVRWSNPLRPVANAKVLAIDTTTLVRKAAYTDANGYFTFTLANGTYKVKMADNPLWRFLPKRRFVTVAGQDVTGVNFEAVPK